jgi:hypothetical protein
MATRGPIEPTTLDRIEFVPSRVDGMADVVRVALTRKGLELWTSQRCRTVSWLSMEPSPFRQLLRRLGLRSAPLFVADRDWFHPPAERFFRFYTTPRMTICLPDEPRKIPYDETFFFRVRMFLEQNGLATNDLG